MYIKRLTLHNFRNYSELSILPDRGSNVLLGKNAQGKTSLIEAIYLLATARSWRAGKDSEMIKWDADQGRVWAEVAREAQNDVEIEVTLGRSEKKQVTVNTIRQTRLADLLGKVNIVLIEPEDVDIVRGDPSKRRRFMNLEISQIQPRYCHLLVNYRRVLDQRNRLLKEMQRGRSPNGVLGVLNEQLVAYGAQIVERRLAFVEHIARFAGIIYSQITDGGEGLRMAYVSSFDLGGYSESMDLARKMSSHMEEVRAEEIKRGVTLVGPQRDDLVLTVNGVDARVYGSQGQQRTIALSLRLAELEMMEEAAQEPPVVLLDDVMTDLDEERRAHIFEMARGRCQTFVTAASRRVFDREFLEESRIFNVSEGRVTAS